MPAKQPTARAPKPEPKAETPPTPTCTCEVSRTENNVGGITVAHPGPRGEVARSFSPDEEGQIAAWLEQVHAEATR